MKKALLAMMVLVVVASCNKQNDTCYTCKTTKKYIKGANVVVSTMSDSSIVCKRNVSEIEEYEVQNSQKLTVTGDTAYSVITKCK